MTPAQIVGWIALALACAAAAWRGGRPERLGALLLAAAWVVTPLVELRSSWRQPQIGILGVDIVTLAALAWLAMRYDRTWPICAAGFQAIAVLTHLAFLVNPQALWRAYLVGNFAIGFLLLGAVVGGVVMEGRAPSLRRRPLWPPRSAWRSSP